MQGFVVDLEMTKTARPPDKALLESRGAIQAFLGSLPRRRPITGDSRLMGNWEQFGDGAKEDAPSMSYSLGAKYIEINRPVSSLPWYSTISITCPQAVATFSAEQFPLFLGRVARIVPVSARLFVQPAQPIANSILSRPSFVRSARLTKFCDIVPKGYDFQLHL